MLREALLARPAIQEEGTLARVEQVEQQEAVLVVRIFLLARRARRRPRQFPATDHKDAVPRQRRTALMAEKVEVKIAVEQMVYGNCVREEMKE